MRLNPGLDCSKIFGHINYFHFSEIQDHFSVSDLLAETRNVRSQHGLNLGQKPSASSVSPLPCRIVWAAPSHPRAEPHTATLLLRAYGNTRTSHVPAPPQGRRGHKVKRLITIGRVPNTPRRKLLRILRGQVGIIRV